MMFGQRERERRLAARGRPCDKHRPFGASTLAHVQQVAAAMTHVATLISNPDAAALDEAALARARSALPSPGDPRWLAARIAADLPFSPAGENDNNDEHAWTERLRESLAGEPIDVVVQPNANRRKRLLIADMDSTMIGQECVDELADRVGLKARVAAITERAMRGDIAF